MTYRAPEKAFQNSVLELATMYGWSYYHPPDNKPTRGHDGRVRMQRVIPGWPDLILVRPPEILAVELKTDTGKLKPEQAEWLQRLDDCGVETHLWRPADFDVLQARLSRPRVTVAA